MGSLILLTRFNVVFMVRRSVLDKLRSVSLAAVITVNKKRFEPSDRIFEIILLAF